MPFVQILITSIIACNQPFVVAIDSSAVGDGCMCLMINFLYKNRALPLVWCVVKQKKGHVPEDRHVQVLKELQPLIPNDIEVIVLGDGEFDVSQPPN